MDITDLENTINTAWENRNAAALLSAADVHAVETALALLDKGSMRVAERNENGAWHVNQWLKKAILLSFRLRPMALHNGAPQNGHWWDKVDSKFQNWTHTDWQQARFRAVPNCVVRHSAYIAENAVLMPSFVNVGAYIGAGTMVDTWATVGSCAQIGAHVHLSGGVGIGGVLEPMQANPTIIEDNCFIGARSEVVEGVIVRKNAVLGMGVFLGQSTKIIDRDSGETFYGTVPEGSVVVAGSVPSKGGVHLYCAVIVKRVDAKTRAKTSINDLLRA